MLVSMKVIGKELLETLPKTFFVPKKTQGQVAFGALFVV